MARKIVAETIFLIFVYIVYLGQTLRQKLSDIVEVSLFKLKIVSEHCSILFKCIAYNRPRTYK